MQRTEKYAASQTRTRKRATAPRQPAALAQARASATARLDKPEHSKEAAPCEQWLPASTGAAWKRLRHRATKDQVAKCDKALAPTAPQSRHSTPACFGQRPKPAEVAHGGSPAAFRAASPAAPHWAAHASESSRASSPPDYGRQTLGPGPPVVFSLRLLASALDSEVSRKSTRGPHDASVVGRPKEHTPKHKQSGPLPDESHFFWPQFWS